MAYLLLSLLAFGLLLLPYSEESITPFCSRTTAATFIFYIIFNFIDVNTFLLTPLIMLNVLAFYYEFKNFIISLIKPCY
ncbi:MULTISPECIES: hypothetical protein [Bacillus cereus group]|uniref:hypothetical protein n=1 Tax=Bacillus cereus group TaxID=86661 RepID=UPI0002E67912|nr:MULTISPECIES: hypothetical protein [Bacillus cereus group]PDZ62256.1 hypothetical protein CON29_16320 [Bacillus thuringiensis]PER69543.1 hypothetical protein CN502_09920 [Bacillus cereus]PES52456.1 hypothetical protein CN515_12365 [Bacillus cereus]PFD43704.1 hypothetical protein CN293_28260 [Bacillus cereus]HDX9596046.1 hypothetical protein [Bacillus cereus]